MARGAPFVLTAAVVASAAGLASPALGAQITARWLTATSDNWSNAARWSTDPIVPNNQGATTYRVVFDAAGPAYVASLTSAITVDELLLNSADATVRLSGGANLGILGELRLDAGRFELQGATLRGATIVAGGGSLVFAGDVTSTLDGVTFSGAHSISAVFSRARIVNGMNFTPGSSLRVAGIAPPVVFAGDQAITGGNLILDHPSATVSPEGTATLTIAPGASVVGRGILGTATSANALINNGQIAASYSGGTLTVGSASFTNNGGMHSDPGTTLVINSPSWTNNGTISANNSTLKLLGNWGGPGTVSVTNTTLELGGTFTTDGVLQTTNSTVRLSGTADNAGRTISFNAASPGWTMLSTSSRIRGGTLAFADGQGLTLQGNGALEDVRLTGPARISTSQGNSLHSYGAFRVEDSLALNGLIAATFQGPVDVNGSLAISPVAQTQVTADDRFDIAPGAALTVAPGKDLWISGVGSLHNAGTMSFSGAGSEVWLRTNTMTNTGTIEMIGGSELRIGQPGTTFENFGTVRVTQGPLVLGGTLSTPALGTFEVPGDRIYLVGNIDNTGSTFTLNASTGSWKAAGGEIRGGTINFADGATFLFNDPAYSSGSTIVLGLRNSPTLNGNLTVIPVSGRTNSLSIEGLTLNGTITVTQPDANIYVSTGTLQGGEYLFASPSGGNSMRLEGSDSVTLSPTTYVHGGRAGIGSTSSFGNDATLVNHGRISADVSGLGFSIGAQHFHSDGILEAINGGILSVGAVGNTGEAVIDGVLRVTNNSAISLGSRVRFGPNMTWDRTGGTVTLKGTLLNQNQTLLLDTRSGNILLDASTTQPTILGGTIAFRDGAVLTPISNESGFYPLLSGVTVDGILPLGRNERFQVQNGLNLQGEIRLAPPSGTAVLNMVGNNTMSGSGTIVLDGAGTPLFSVNINGSLTLGEGITVRGGSTATNGALVGSTGSSFGNNTTLINNGVISADKAGSVIGVWATTIANHGVLEARDGGILRMRADSSLASWSNTGLIRVLPGSSLTLANYVRTEDLGDIREEGGDINASGLKIANGDNTLTFNAATGSWRFVDSVIKGGIVRCLDDQFLSCSGLTLDGLTLLGDAVSNNVNGILIAGDVDVQGTLHLSGSGSVLRFVDSGRLRTGIVSFESTGAESAITGPGVSATLTIAPGATVRGGNGAIRSSDTLSILNEGLISADVDQQKIRIFTQRFTNFGTIQALNGGIIEFIPPPGLNPLFSFFNSGALRLSPGSDLVVPGDFTQGEDALLFFALSVPDSQPLLDVQGLLTLDGALGVGFHDGFRPAVGTEFHLFDAYSLSGEFRDMQVRPLAYGRSWDLSSVPIDGTIRVVPAVGTAGTLALGFAPLLARRRRPNATKGGTA